MEPVQVLWAVSEMATDLSPHVYQGTAATSPYAYQLGSTLTTYDVGSLAGNGCDEVNGPGSITGDLAESWETNADGTVITFNLRRGVMSAYGNELTSADVLWSLEYDFELDGIAKFLFFIATNFEGGGEGQGVNDLITVIDDYTFEYHLKSPTPIDLAILEHWSMRIVDSTEAKKNVTADDPWATEWLAENGAYFGPWTFGPDDFMPGEQLTLRANPNFYGSRGNADSVVMFVVPDAGTRVQLLQSGEADFADALSLDQFNSLKNADGVTVRECIGTTRDILFLNFTDERFMDPRVRSAISLALDRNAIAQGAFLGLAKPSVGGVHGAYFPDGAPVLAAYERDLDAARALLADAGYTDLSFTLTYSPVEPGPWAEQLALLVQAQLAEAGITVELERLATAAEYTERLQAGEVEAYPYGQNPAINSVYYSMLQSNKTGSFTNYHGYSNEEFEGLLQQMEQAGGQTALDDLRNLSHQFMADDLPEIALVERLNVSAYSSAISDLNNYGNVEFGDMFLLNKNG